MKFLLLSLMLALSSFAWSRNSKSNFNKALLEDVKKDIQKDEDKFRALPQRGPASVEMDVAPMPKEESPIEKKVKRLGTQKW